MPEYLVHCKVCIWTGRRKIVQSQPCPKCKGLVEMCGRGPHQIDCKRCRGRGGNFGFCGGSTGNGRRTHVCKECLGTGVEGGRHGLPYCDNCNKPSETVTAVGYGFVLCPACLAKEGITDA